VILERFFEHSLVVERLLLVVHGDEIQAVPGALLHGDLVAQRLDELIPLRRAEAAELDVGAPGPNRRHLLRRRRDKERPVPVEIGLTLVPVVGILLSHPLRALDVLDEQEGPGAHDVRLVPMHVLGQDVGLVDPVPGRGQVQEERRLRPLEAETDRVGIRGFHHFDRVIGILAQRLDPRGREDDLVVRRLDVLRGHLAAIVELHALAQLERVDQAVLRDGPGFGQITDRFGPGLVEGIHPHQGVVVRRRRVDEPERLLLVGVVGGRLRRHHEGQHAAVSRLVLGDAGDRPGKRQREGEDDERADRPPTAMAHGPPPR
jgi:hypothetical protein